MYIQSHGSVCVHMYMHCRCIHAPCKIQGILSKPVCITHDTADTYIHATASHIRILYIFHTVSYFIWKCAMSASYRESNQHWQKLGKGSTLGTLIKPCPCKFWMLFNFLSNPHHCCSCSSFQPVSVWMVAHATPTATPVCVLLVIVGSTVNSHCVSWDRVHDLAY